VIRASEEDLHAGAAAPAERRSREARRDDVVLDAELRRIVRELRFGGPLRRDALAHRCHADAWHRGSFDGALLAGVRRGVLRSLPFDFVDVALPPARPAPSARGGRAARTRRLRPRAGGR
jgi:hypothetical protein